MSDLTSDLEKIAEFIDGLGPGVTINVNVNLGVGVGAGVQPGPDPDPDPDPDPGEEEQQIYRVDASRDPSKKNNKVKVRSTPDPSSGEFAHLVTGDFVTGTGLFHKAGGVNFTQIDSPYSGWVESLFLVAQ